MIGILLLSFLPARVEVDHVDWIELNSVVSQDGKTEQLRQYIFWQLQTVDFEPNYHVVGWRLYDHVNARPVSRGDLWSLAWHDKKVRRCVVGRVFKETKGNYDPELKDRDVLPCDKRRGALK